MQKPAQTGDLARFDKLAQKGFTEFGRLCYDTAHSREAPGEGRSIPPADDIESTASAERHKEVNDMMNHSTHASRTGLGETIATTLLCTFAPLVLLLGTLYAGFIA